MNSQTTYLGCWITLQTLVIVEAAAKAIVFSLVVKVRYRNTII